MLWTTVATAAVAAYGAYQQGQAQEANLKYQAESDRYNRDIQARNATLARQQAGAREEAQRRRAKQFMGEQQAQLSQAGAGLSGSYADVIGQSAADAELDALNIRYEGELQAMGLLEQSQQSELSARVNRINARQAGRAGNTAAASTLLSGASNAYGYYRSPKG
jgi:hypothetical protein